MGRIGSIEQTSPQRQGLLQRCRAISWWSMIYCSSPLPSSHVRVMIDGHFAYLACMLHTLQNGWQWKHQHFFNGVFYLNYQYYLCKQLVLGVVREEYRSIGSEVVPVEKCLDEHTFVIGLLLRHCAHFASLETRSTLPQPRQGKLRFGSVGAIVRRVGKLLCQQV